jgi:DNA processing protein
VLAVPGNIDRPTSVGSNDLLKEGCVPVTETADVLHALGLVVLPARSEHQRTLPLDIEDPVAQPRRAQPNAPDLNALTRDLPENQRKIVAILSGTPRHIDTIAQDTGLSAGQTGVEMTLLELAGLVRRLPGNTYILALN